MEKYAKYEREPKKKKKKKKFHCDVGKKNHLGMEHHHHHHPEKRQQQQWQTSLALEREGEKNDYTQANFMISIKSTPKSS